MILLTRVGSYKAEDGNDYYTLALNLETNDKLLIKNAGCTAAAEAIAMDYWHLDDSLYGFKKLKFIWLGTDPDINPKKIPKKYHKIVFSH